MIKDLI